MTAPGGVGARGRPGCSAQYLVDVVRDNPDNFRIFGPDETASNRLDAVYEVTDKVFAGEILASRRAPGPLAAGWWRCSPSTPARAGWRATCSPAGTGSSAATRRSSTSSTRCSTSTRSGSRRPASIEWRPPIASLNYLLTSHVWRQDHNGFSHQDPGFIDHVVNKKAEVVRVYLPPDTNTLLSTMRHCLASQHYVNVVVAGKQPSFDWLDADAGRPALRPRAGHLGLGLQREATTRTW